MIEEVESNPDIRGIVLEIDSSGGYDTTGKEIADALKRAGKPTVAFIRGLGLSAGYYAATGADMIFASPLADVGSIGITMSYLDYSEQNKQEGITLNILSSGKFKDALSYDKPLTNEERALIMRDINKAHEIVVSEIAQNRNLAREKIAPLADGSSMLGPDALELGLVDQIGGLPEVRAYLAEKIGHEVEICNY
jgi:protease-4